MATDEIEQLEMLRAEGGKAGPLSDQQREVYTGNQRYNFRMEKEPIFEAILLNMVLGNSVNLKKKARIKVPNAAVLMGVIDERSLL